MSSAETGGSTIRCIFGLGASILFSWVLTLIPYYEIVASFVIAPLLALFLGRRFRCSWICPKGASAKTVGDPVQRLAPKTELSRKLEITAYCLLGITVIITLLLFFEEDSKFLVLPCHSACLGHSDGPLSPSLLWRQNLVPLLMPPRKVSGVTIESGTLSHQN